MSATTDTRSLTLPKLSTRIRWRPRRPRNPRALLFLALTLWIIEQAVRQYTVGHPVNAAFSAALGAIDWGAHHRLRRAGSPCRRQ